MNPNSFRSSFAKLFLIITIVLFSVIHNSYASTQTQPVNFGGTITNLGQTNLGFDSSTPFSVSFTMNRGTTIANECIVCKLQTAFVESPGWGIWTDGQVINFQMTGQHSNAIRVRDTVLLDNNQPQNVLITYDGSGSANGVQFSVNGASVSGQIVTNNLASSPSNSLNTMVGSMSDGVAKFTGTLTNLIITNGIAVSVSASPPGGSYNSAQSVTLTASPSSATVYYTTDGSTPTTTSTQYSGPIPISSTTTLKFIAKDSSGQLNTIGSAQYTINVSSTGTQTQPVNFGGTITNLGQTNLGFDSSTPFSVSFTMNRGTTIANECIVCKLQTAFVESPGWGIWTDGQVINFQMTGQHSNAIRVRDTVLLDNNQPQNVLITYDGSGSANGVQFSVNGASVSGQIVTNNLASSPSNSLNTMVGSMSDGVAKFTGTLTNLIITNGIAVSVSASPPGGSYNSAQSVTLTASPSSATVYYTTDGSTPTTTSTQYSGPIPISSTTTLKFIAKDSSGQLNTIGSAQYTINVSSTGTQTQPVNFGGTITNLGQTNLGFDSSTPFSVSFTMNRGTTIANECIVCKLQTAFVESPGWGIWTDGQVINFQMTGQHSNAIRVRDTVLLDNNQPQNVLITYDGSGSANGVQFSVNGASVSGQIVTNNLASSPSNSLNTMVGSMSDGVAKFTGTLTNLIITNGIAVSVSASPPGGSYNSAQSVTLTASPSSATVYYTTDGSTPTTTSTQYSGPITISSTTTLKFFAKNTLGQSSVSTATYKLPLPITVTALPFPDTYDSAQSITLTSSRIPATIYYTTDGSTPTISSTSGASPLSGINVGSTTTIKFFAKDNLGNIGPVGSAHYEIILPGSLAVSASPTGGTFSSSQSVTLTASKPSTIYYTTDGSDPTNSSTNHSSPVTGITINSDSTLKFFAQDGNTTTSIQSETYAFTTSTSQFNKVAMINFDDNYASQLNAKPTLDQYGIKATFYVICDRVGQSGYMSWNDVKQLQADGQDIQAHTMDHLHANSLTQAQLDYQYGKSAACIASSQNASIIGINTVAIPFNEGGNNPTVINTIAKYFSFARGINFQNPHTFHLHCNDPTSTQTDCRTYDSGGNLNTFTRYTIPAWSSDLTGTNDNNDDTKSYAAFVAEVNKATTNTSSKPTEIPVLYYHRIVSTNSGLSSSQQGTTQTLFDAEMQYLHDNNFKIFTTKNLGYDSAKNWFFIK